MFTFSSRQDSTDNEIEIKVKIGAVLPEREYKQSEPVVTLYFSLGHSVCALGLNFYNILRTDLVPQPGRHPAPVLLVVHKHRAGALGAEPGPS